MLVCVSKMYSSQPRLGLDLLIPEFIYVFIQIEDPSATTCPNMINASRDFSSFEVQSLF
jgi:hypothetical protein